ncbi:MAG TPA: HAMP domain-containing sensor histidine kinase, partial [Isosphaeraceae bacterium]
MENPLNPRFLSLVVHDLRTPLNVIGLSLHIIERTVSPDQSDVVEDLRAIRDNIVQMERMLAYLADYCRLISEPARPAAVTFSPRTLLEELVETQALRAGPGGAAVQLEVGAESPPAVELDERLARLALQYALNNATSSANGQPVRVRLGGGQGRCLIEFHVDRPPKSSVRPVPLQPDSYERLMGTAEDRRGLDLAIVARITELFGGSARLEVTEGRGTAIVL